MNDELLIKFLLNESNPEENEKVNNWLALADENVIYLSQLEKIWMESKKLSSRSEVDIDAAWVKFKANANALPPVKLKSWNNWMRIAAVLVLGIGSLMGYITFKSKGYIDVNANSQVLTQVLPDGSELTLNKFSHIKFANNFKSNRSIQLDSGDVFFNVTKDKSRPFVIKIDEIAVEVVGTSFNIKHLNSQTEVVVETGIVKVSLGNEEVLLHKGEKVILPKGVRKLEKLPVNDQLYTYYRSKLFIADQTPLPTLIAILNEAYGSKVVVEGAAKELTINTILPYEKSLDYNLKTIVKTFENLRLRRNQNEIILSY